MLRLKWNINSFLKSTIDSEEIYVVNLPTATILIAAFLRNHQRPAFFFMVNSMTKSSQPTLPNNANLKQGQRKENMCDTDSLIVVCFVRTSRICWLTMKGRIMQNCIILIKSLFNVKTQGQISWAQLGSAFCILIKYLWLRMRL